MNRRQVEIFLAVALGRRRARAAEIGVESLVENIRVMMGDDHGQVVHIRGDTEAVYGEVVTVMDWLTQRDRPIG